MEKGTYSDYKCYCCKPKELNMKVEAWKSDNGILHETEKACQIENIKLKIINFLNPPKDKSHYLYSTLSDFERRRFSEELANKILTDTKEFKDLIEEITSIVSR